MPVIIHEMNVDIKPPTSPAAPGGSPPPAGEAAQPPAPALPDGEQLRDLVDFLARRSYRLWAH